MFEDESVDVVYIVMLYLSYVEWVVKVVKVGKYIFCEKLVVMNYVELMGIYVVVECVGVFVMEVFMYRCYLLMENVVWFIKDGVVGDVCMIEVRFGFVVLFDLEYCLFFNVLGGGGIFDIGCYFILVVWLIVGVVLGRVYVEL